MTKLKSGVYLVKFKDINNFIKDAEKNGWKLAADEPQKRIKNILTARGRSEKTVKQLVIPFSLDQEIRRVGWWTKPVCFESEVKETMRTWKDYGWSDNYIEFYQDKKLIL